MEGAEEEDLVEGVVDQDLAPLTVQAPSDQVEYIQADPTVLPQVPQVEDLILLRHHHHHREGHLLQETLRQTIIQHGVVGLFQKQDSTE